jgi:hypothetical protein
VRFELLKAYVHGFKRTKRDDILDRLVIARTRDAALILHCRGAVELFEPAYARLIGTVADKLFNRPLCGSVYSCFL